MEVEPSMIGKSVMITAVSTVMPVAVMHQYLPAGRVLGVHPMFGPGAVGIAHHNFVLTPTSNAEIALARKVREYLEARGDRVELMTPDAHDDVMSVVLGLGHFIALVSADTLLSFNRLEQMAAVGGTTYKVLLTLAEGVLSEDPEQYASLQMSLPNMMEIEKLFQEKGKIWADLVEKKDKPEFVEKMKALRSRLEEGNPDFGKAYENMYKIVDGL